MTQDQIKHMVDRFLNWRLPKNFNPDGGISAKRPNYAPNVEWTPSGTNLLDAQQAEAMVRHMIEGLPDGLDALSQLHAFVGVMFGEGPDATIPETVRTPLGIPVKIGEIMRKADEALRASVRQT